MNLHLGLRFCDQINPFLFQDDEMQSIRDLISSAVLDPDVKGGLRWPLGKESSGDRYKVVGIWHVIANMYTNPSLRLKVRHADRFDFRTSTGEATWEVSLMLKKVVSKLQVSACLFSGIFSYSHCIYYIRLGIGETSFLSDFSVLLEFNSSEFLSSTSILNHACKTVLFLLIFFK